MANGRTVGVNGDNRPEDIEVVQQTVSRWLTESGATQLEITGSLDDTTLAAIAAFQGAVGADASELLEVFDETLAETLSQGQGDGDTIQEARKAAREACIAQLNCGNGSPPKIAKYVCWKGGSQTYTCIVQCSCDEGVV